MPLSWQADPPRITDIWDPNKVLKRPQTEQAHILFEAKTKALTQEDTRCHCACAHRNYLVTRFKMLSCLHRLRLPCAKTHAM